MQGLRSLPALLFTAIVFSLDVSTPAARCQDLVQAPEDVIFYELSNLRVEKGVVADQIAFDYKRTREGGGTPTLAARTDDGPVNIMGLGIKIGATGTIRLEDRFARVRSVLNQGRGDFGVEFYFTLGSASSYPQTRHLVSNSVTYGTMNTRVQARPMSAKELAAKELERKSKVPPETVPSGYSRTDTSTLLVPGAPVLVGTAGEWVPGKIVALAGSTSVKVLRDGEQRILTLPRKDWLAISSDTIREIQTNASQFSLSIRTLPEGNLILDDDVLPLVEAFPNGLLSLAAGTPLLMEKHLRWEDVYFLSSDNVSVRVLPANGPSRTESRAPVKTLAIRQRTVEDLSTEAAKTAFAANVASYTPRITTPNIASSSASRASAIGSSRGSMATNTPFPTTPESDNADRDQATVSRVWTDQTGKFSVTATLQETTVSEVVLKRPDGSVVKVPIAKLSDADQEFLQTNGSSNDQNPFAEVTSSTSALSMPAAAGPLDYQKPLTGVFGVSDLRWGAKSLAISPDNRYLLVGRNAASASMYDLKSGRLLVDSGRMNHLGDISACGFTPDNRHLLLGGTKGVVEVYEIDRKGELKIKQQFAAHTRGITSLSFSRDGKFALTGGEDKQAMYWEIETGRTLNKLTDFDGKIKATCITPSGKTLMATDGQTLRILNLDDKENVRSLEVGRSHVMGQSAAFSPNGLLLAVANSYDFQLWNLQTESELPKLNGNDIAWSAIFAPDSQHLITGGNGVISIWDTKTQTRVQSAPVSDSFYIQALTINADGSLISCPNGHDSVGIYQASR